MTGTRNPLRPFWATVGIGWVLLGIAAVIYARLMKVPGTIALPIALAFLFEYPFYLLPGFADARDRFMAKGKSRPAALLTISAILPWLIYALPTGHFSFPALVVVVCIALLMNFWYILFPANPAADLIYLCLFGALMVLKIFPRIYPAPWPKIDVSALGRITLIRVMAFSISGIRGSAGADYRFWPTTREWLAGARWFVILLPATGVVYWALGLVSFRAHPQNIALVIGTFLGILWTTAIFEEFIFRGLLLQWFENWTASPIAALAATSLLFGSVHLNFHGAFPNWRFAIVAAVLGLFLGMARRKTGGIQTGMVAHALTVAVWRMFQQ